MNNMAHFSGRLFLVGLLYGAIMAGLPVTGEEDFTTDASVTTIGHVSTTIHPDKPHGEDVITDSGLLAVYHMTTFFLDDIVQTKDLRWLQSRGVDFSQPDTLWEQADWEVWAEYGLGFSVCIALGVLLLIVVPLVGAFVACCRCCGHCGGRVRPRESKNANCQKACCSVLLLLFTTLIVLAAVTMVFTAIKIDEQLSDEESNTFRSVAHSIRRLDDYVDTTIAEVEHASLGNFVATTDQVFEELDRVVEGAIHELDNATQATASIEALAQLGSSLDAMLQNLRFSELASEELDLAGRDVNIELAQINSSLSNGLAACSTTQCELVKGNLEYLETDANFSFFNFSEDIRVLELFLGSVNLTHEMEIALEQIRDVSDKAQSQVEPEIEKAEEDTDQVEQDIRAFLEELTEQVNKVDFGEASEAVDDVWQEVEGWVWDAVFFSLLGLAILVLLICLCFFLGLIHGICCERPSPSSNYCCTKKQGADWLMAGSGLTFIFYWLFMLVTIAMFAAGGVTHTEVCRHMVKFNESPVADILTELINNSFVENNDISINLTELYTDCGEDKALYTTLELDKVAGLNITEIMDTQLIEDALEDIKSVSIDIENVDFIDQTLIDELEILDEQFTKLHRKLIMYSYELEKNILKLPNGMSEFINQLKNISSTDADVSQEIKDLEQLNDENIKNMTELKEELQSALSEIRTVLNTINVTNSAESLEMAQNTFNADGGDIIGGYVNDTADMILGTIESMTAVIEREVRQDVGRCYPVYDVVLDIVDTACIQLLYPINGYWFALGWCILFFIPSIIIAFKLTTLYRKTYKYDEDAHGGVGYTHAYQREDNGAYFDRPMELPLVYSANQGPTGNMPAMDNPVYQTDDILYRIPRPAVKVLPQDLPPSYSEVASQPKKNKTTNL